MPDPLDDSRPDIHHRSLGEKLLRVASTVSRLVPEEFSFFFDLFFSCRSPPSVCYCESSPFPWPSFLRWSHPLSDSSQNLLRFYISPAILSIGFSKKGKQIHPSYEFYHPAVFARQFGFNQAVPRLILAKDMESRDRIKDARHTKESLAGADHLLLSDLPSYRLPVVRQLTTTLGGARSANTCSPTYSTSTRPLVPLASYCLKTRTRVGQAVALVPILQARQVTAIDRVAR